MAIELPGCDDGVAQEHDCCDNQYTQITTDDTFAKVSFDIDLNKTFVTTFVSVFVLLQSENYPKKTNFFTEYHPPPLALDYQVLYETFLI
jgi:hypothetical protein